MDGGYGFSFGWPTGTIMFCFTTPFHDGFHSQASAPRGFFFATLLYEASSPLKASSSFKASSSHKVSSSSHMEA
jgi:hypothetical protein